MNIQEVLLAAIFGTLSILTIMACFIYVRLCNISDTLDYIETLANYELWTSIDRGEPLSSDPPEEPGKS